LHTAAWLLSCETGLGHSCLELAAVAGKPFLDDSGADDDVLPCAPELDTWCRLLADSGVVGAPGDATPLILDSACRLYLARYWEYERSLAHDLLARAQPMPQAADQHSVRRNMGRLFPASPAHDSTDWQQVAAAVAICRRLAIIAGGPGTGKTYVVARTLLLLLTHNAAAQPLRIALAAPTGKAANRLAESIQAAIETSSCEDSVKDLIPREATTVHRLLRPSSRGGGFRHDRLRPLDVDVLVVDECSMMDLPLMARLVEALPEQARLILLGDRDQLASVEAGSVFADLCGGYHETRLSPDFAGALSLLVQTTLEPVASASRSPLAESIVVLTRGHRFGTESAIAALARAVKQNDVSRLGRLLEGNAGQGVSRQDLRSRPQRDELWRTLVKRYTELLSGGFGEERAEEMLAALSRLKVLCALRKGPYGVEQVNRRIADGLRAKGIIAGDHEWYPGRPIMITRNDYQLGLYNGDVGVLLVSAEGRLRAIFKASDGQRLLAVTPTRLPTHETAFAMTVHKSQGSEFDRVVLILPPQDTPVVTRELVYTGITRARHRVEIYGPAEAVIRAAGRPERRRGGLRDKLWGAWHSSV
jgi:exodeoxyribonuclease V alpha subunit